MPIAFSLLLICIVFASGTALQDGAAPQSLLAIFIVLALARLATVARAADVKFVAQVTKGIKFAAAIPAAWMLIQVLPTPIGAHSIWSYANEALGHESFGHISVDLGATLRALIWYLANLALIIVAIFVTSDRRRAELVLLVLTSTAAAISAVSLAATLGTLPFLVANEQSSRAFVAVAGFGVLLALTTCVRAVERYESRSAHSSGGLSLGHLQLILLAAGLVLLCCVSALIASQAYNLGLVVLFSSLLFASVQIVRRIGMGGWATTMLLATIALAAIMIVVWRYDAARSVSPLLQFSTGSAEELSTVQRMLSDSGLKGFGAGTFAAVLPLYQASIHASSIPPTTIAAMAIELGWPQIAVALATAALLFALLYRGALQRGRDAFYPGLSAACVFLVAGQAFCDSSLLNSCVAVIADTIIGLGLAQSVSRRDVS